MARAPRYADLNPVLAGLVRRSLDYPWSSARAHATGRDVAGLLDLSLWNDVCRLRDWEDVLRAPPEADTGWVEPLRSATRSGKPLGNNDFVRELESGLGAELRVRPPGRPPKKTGAGLAAQAAGAT